MYQTLKQLKNKARDGSKFNVETFRGERDCEIKPESHRDASMLRKSVGRRPILVLSVNNDQ